MNTSNILVYALFILVITLLGSAWIAGSLVGRPIQQLANLGYYTLSNRGRSSSLRRCC